MDIRKVSSWIAGGALALFANSALAIVCNSPLGAGEDRNIEILITGVGDSAVMVCADSSSGNEPNPLVGYTQLEKDEANSSTGLLRVSGIPNNGPGTWGVTSAGTGGSFALLFKFGGGSGNPDWWLITFSNVAYGADAIITGTWAWFSGAQNGLSHVSLYSCDQGQCRPPDQVPEPGTLGLLGLGLAGLGFGLRRRRKA